MSSSKTLTNDNNEIIDKENYNQNKTIEIKRNKTSIFYKGGTILNITIKNPSIDNGYWEIKNFRFNKKFDLIGNGSYGNVYLTHHRIDNKPYAIKLIEKKKLKKLNYPIKIIYREISYQIQLNHPNIIRLYSFHEDEENIFMILEYSNNGTLFSKIRKQKFLLERESFKYFIEVVNAVNFLHKNNFIHRDIKPENILLNENNNIKLCDFGSCVQIQENEKRNTICGTFEYMSPELLKQEKYNFNVDIWALGILLFEMLHGKSPFKPNVMFNNKDDERKEIFNNAINSNFEIDKMKNLSPECIDLINILLRRKDFNNYEFKVSDIYQHIWVKKFQNENKKKLIIPEQKIKRNHILGTKALSIDLGSKKNINVPILKILYKNNNNFMDNKNSDLEIKLNNKPIIMNNENKKIQNSKTKLILKKNISNSYFKEIHNDVNNIKKSDSHMDIRRVLSNQTEIKKKIILKNVEKKQSFWDFFFN